MFFDSHCHLNTPTLAADFEAIVERASAVGVLNFLNVADNLESALQAIEQARAVSDPALLMRATAGVHPQNAAQWDGRSAALLRHLAGDPQVCAVGEIGLDFVYDDTHAEHPGASRARQEEVLVEQLQIAVELDLPVVLHNREADDRLPSVVAQFPALRGVFHCFASPLPVARQALDLGFHLGFTGLVTFKNAAAVREVAAYCPLDRMLIETDSPYLAPVPFRGKTNEPSYLPRVVEALAMLHSMPEGEIGRITTANACRLFGVQPAAGRLADY